MPNSPTAAAPLQQLFADLRSRETGLSSAEVEERRRDVGPNLLPEPPSPSRFRVFISQFASPLIYILLAATAIVFYMGEVADGAIILFVLLFNAIVGTIQEGRAQNILRALRTYARGTATVLRDGKETIVPDDELVPGDMLMLREGEKVPADARLIAARRLRTDESMLTGESFPVDKNAEAAVQENARIQDQASMVFKGTTIVGGAGEALVTATGVRTEIGKISLAVTSLTQDLPLKRNIAFLSRAIIVAVVIISGIVLLLGAWRDEPFRVMFATVVSLAVSVIPEGLPIVMTLVLASGVWRMSKRRVLVKRLQAVEGLGQAKIIAVDKTGTLTKNEMTLERVFIDGKLYEVGGNGYEATGEVLFEGKVVDPLNHPDLLLAAHVAHFASEADAFYLEKERVWKVSGDPTEAALRVFARKVGFKDVEAVRTFDMPFSSATKYHLTVHQIKDKHFLAAVGAPETILQLSERAWHGRAEQFKSGEKEEMEKVFSGLSRQGYRLLGFAFDPVSESQLHGDHLPPLVFGGYFAIRDPLREEAHAAIARAQAAGIRIVMITGDHVLTATAIAREAGIFRADHHVITGDELDQLPEDELVERFAHCSVFARVTPDQKMKIIGVFKKRGEIVAMTGDGVNDAPSLAAADLGVAMGKIGTEVTKEAADLVLLDDDFGDIVTAIEEGRNIYRAIRRVVLYLFSTGAGEVFAIMGAIAVGLPLPVLPVQIIWLNFVTDGFLDVALALEPKEDGLLERNFPKPARYILDGPSFWRMIFMGAVIAIGTLLLFAYYLPLGLEKAIAVSLTVLAAFQWFNAWNCRSGTDSIFNKNIFKNRYLVAATIVVICLQLVALYVPIMQDFLHTVPLTLRDWAFIIPTAASVLVLEELRKFVVRRRERRNS